ncbi:hypothetical protein QNA08_13405 [Chelatococcus sp. SYSU_G07232]|uniref:Uncharacterized protein n=1 Tax=Chelatococcus albus TaxID=3047466 RepID=A0ABT7AIL9_9HYPH|nr:hypothetical protein [Chelatococcus sp. SYSU_G07232]MDJ1159231.1 hypothetical protein [Chelatococcus sp. SYSU_G07232]
MSLSRRALLAGLAAAGLTGRAVAQAGGQVFSRIAVDVSALRVQGLGPWADLVAESLDDSLRREFVGRIAPGARGAPMLVARINGMSLPAYVGSGGGPRFNGSGGNGTNDYLDGELLVVTAGGRQVLERKPILSAVPAASAGAWYQPDIDRQRVLALTRHFAGWARRMI